MAKIHINNPKQVINGGAKKYYFKVKGLGGPKGDKGDKGDTGSQGPQGPQGNAATVSVGSTTTLPVGQDATVQNVGTLYNAVLNFGIPQGPRGPQGATGATGAKGDKGDQGNPGPQGEKGTNATVYIGTTTTGEPGTQAIVYNSGTASNAVLNFTIPRGDVGPMPTIAQSTGQATDQVMSQKATTDALNTKQATITSSNKLSADLVDDTSTTNKFVSASDITNWNGKQDALTAGTGLTLTGTEFSADTTVLATKTDLEDYYTKTETDTKLAPKLETEVVTTLPTTGDEGKLYLTPKAHTTSTATGNPITATVAEEAGAIESFQLDGDTFQQSYEGKNLFNGIMRQGNQVANSVTTHIFSSGDGIQVESGETYTFSTDLDTTTYDYALYIADVPYPTGADSHTLWYSGYGTDPSRTFTASVSGYLGFTVRRIAGGNLTPADVSGNHFQIESGSTATSFEPFVGGTPSPSPDYPQPIQTVTGENVVKINGKNLLNPDTPKTYGYLDSHGRLYVGGSRNEACFDFMPVEENTTYTFKIFETSDAITSEYWFGVGAYSSASESGFITMPFRGSADTRPYVTFTTPTGCNFIRISGRYLLHATKLQLEQGSTVPATYEPYQYHSYPLDLGNIELCKLGDYQDYIWKDGEDWKIVKKVGVVPTDSSTTVTTGQFGTNSYAIALPGAINSYTQIRVLSEFFVGKSYNDRTSEQNNFVYMSDIGNTNYAYIRNTSWASIDAFKTWLGQNNPKFYYTMATTTITVTDSTLIAQLEAIRTASLQNGTNIIESTATGSNLAGGMQIGYYGFSSHYDKWLWLDIDDKYEKITDTVSVDAIQYNLNMRSVAHQGFSTTGETYGNCRLSSYIGAKQHGFDFAECDLQWTSDMIPVCCHDASFNSNGTTVVIADHTLAELKTYSYYGETIASFEEVLAKCKSLGLGLYIDKSWFDQTHFNIMAAIVDKYQMQDNVYWLLQGAVQPTFDMINNWYPNAKYSVVLNTGATAPTEAQIQAVVDFANQNKTVNNYISIDVNHSYFTVEQLASLSAQLTHGVQLECWTIDDVTRYKEVLPYLCAITSNKICYNDVYKDLLG